MHQKGDVHYVDHAKGRDHCSICAHFIKKAPTTDGGPRCKIVVGPIAAMGWCTEYKPSASL